MSKGQHKQQNQHAKPGSRGTRLMAKLGLPTKRKPLWKLRKELVK